MTDTPSEAAKRKACELANAAGNCKGWIPAAVGPAWPPMLALALYIDEVDRVVRAIMKLPPTDIWRDTIMRSFMLPDPVDPDEELARAFHDAYEMLAPEFGYSTRKDTRQFDPQSLNGKLMLATIKALREQGRLTDAK